MNPPVFRALIVEDDHSWQQILSEILADCGLAVDVTGSLDEALFALKTQAHRLAVVDLSLSPNDHNNYDGLRVLEGVRQLDPNCRTILLTGFATVELAVTALTDYAAFTFLRKESFHRGQFRELVYRALASAPQPASPSLSSVSAAGSSSRLKPSTFPIRTESAAGKAPGATAGKVPGASAGKALVVEDDAGWRSILEELLTDSGFQVRACNSFGDALGFLRREKFALAVVDLSLNGTVTSLLSRDAFREWDKKNPKVPGGRTGSEDLEGYQLLASTRAGGVPTIVVSGVASPEDIQRAYAEQSIFAYLEKQAFERASFLRIVEEARNARRQDSELAALTDREREVLDLLSQGLTNKEIAEKLVITTNTVKRHLKAVFEKLDVHTRSAAAAKAIGEK